MTNDVFKPLLENAPVKRVMDIYAQANHEIRFVGGCVRDCLNGVDIGDLDLATTATPQQGQGILKAAGVKTIPTGIDHGTITAIVDGVPFEITTLRNDVTTDGRRATVSFTDSWLEDAKRRDFTMNAMSLSMMGELFDPFDGRGDLKAGRLRFIGDAGQRIEEDALRILRFFRFNAHIGNGDMDPVGLAACIEKAKLLENLSKERIQMEVFKLLKGQNVISVWRAIVESDVNKYFLKKSNNIKCLSKMFHVKHKDCPLLLSLFLPSDRNAQILQAALKLSNSETTRIRNALTVYNDLQSSLSEALYYDGSQAVSDATLLRYGDGLIDESELLRVLAIADDWDKPVFPVSGDDLMAVGYTQGKEMGDALRRIEKYWIDQDFKPTKGECLSHL